MKIGLKYRAEMTSSPLGNYIVNEFDNLVAGLRGHWQIEHSEDGSHTDITAHSLTLEVDEELGATGNLTVEGEGPHTLGGSVVIGGEITLAKTTGLVGPSIDLDGTDVGGVNWSIRVKDDGLSDSLTIRDKTTGANVLSLYRSPSALFGSDYILTPDQDGLKQLHLGSPDWIDSDLEFDTVAGKKAFFRTGIYERLRTTPMGEWETWTPTWTNLSVGDGTVSAQYTIVGKTAYFVINLVIGSTTSVTGQITFSPPESLSVQGIYRGTGVAFDSSASSFYSLTMRELSSTTITTYYLAFPWQATSGTVPFTWAAGDQLQLNGFFRVA